MHPPPEILGYSQTWQCSCTYTCHDTCSHASTSRNPTTCTAQEFQLRVVQYTHESLPPLPQRCLPSVHRLGYALFGVLNGTEINPDFDSEVAAATGGQCDAPVVLYCGQGGSLEPTEQSKTGQQTRSLIAAYQLLQAGYTNIQVLKGGFKEWSSAGRWVAV